MNILSQLKVSLKRKLYNRFKPPNMRGYYGQFSEDAALQTYFINSNWDKTKLWEVKNKGFYVDIGAYSPILTSNTYWFYQHGWDGINIEPYPDVVNEFNKLRPRDINLSVGIAEHESILTFYTWGKSSFNTFSKEKADEYIRLKKVDRPPEILNIQVVRLESVFDKYLKEGQHIDFISIDVEGLDLQVLKSNNWGKYKPELILVELEVRNIGDLLNSDLYKYMIQLGYELYFYLSPSVMFILRK